MYLCAIIAHRPDPTHDTTFKVWLINNNWLRSKWRFHKVFISSALDYGVLATQSETDQHSTYTEHLNTHVIIFSYELKLEALENKKKNKYKKYTKKKKFIESLDRKASVFVRLSILWMKKSYNNWNKEKISWISIKRINNQHSLFWFKFRRKEEKENFSVFFCSFFVAFCCAFSSSTGLTTTTTRVSCD